MHSGFAMLFPSIVIAITREESVVLRVGTGIPASPNNSARRGCPNHFRLGFCDVRISRYIRAREIDLCQGKRYVGWVWWLVADGMQPDVGDLAADCYQK